MTNALNEAGLTEEDLKIGAEGDGNHYIDTLLKKAAELGVEVCYTTKAVNLIRDEKGRVHCVQAEKGGKTILYHAELGVVLATGGFGTNLKMCRQYNTQWDFDNNNILTTNSPAITGDGIIMAEKIGAQLVDMQYIQLYPVNNPATGSHYNLDYARLNSNAILVNKEGKRFVNERATREVIKNHYATVPFIPACFHRKRLHSAFPDRYGFLLWALYSLP